MRAESDTLCRGMPLLTEAPNTMIRLEASPMVEFNETFCSAVRCVCCWSGLGSSLACATASLGGLGPSWGRSRLAGLSSTFARRPLAVAVSVCSPFTQILPIRYTAYFRPLSALPDVCQLKRHGRKWSCRCKAPNRPIDQRRIWHCVKLGGLLKTVYM